MTRASDTGLSGEGWTPRPWRVRRGDEADTICFNGIEPVEVVGANEQVVACNTTYYPTSLDPDNANLIAAAPDLFEAARVVFAGLNERIDAAVAAGEPVPVFAGISALSDALNKAVSK